MLELIQTICLIILAGGVLLHEESFIRSKFRMLWNRKTIYANKLRALRNKVRLFFKK